MSVLIVTSLGDLVIDLFTDKCPLTSKNFLKLSKIKYYNGCLFHTVQKDFTAQTGDPTGTGTGGDSVYKFLYGDQARFFGDEIHLDLKHTKTGTVAMANAGENLNASQFYITLRDDLDYLDGKHTVFGEVAEGFETLTRINEAFVDQKNRPLKNIRIKHTYILEDPFDDPPQLVELIPDASPEGKPKDEVDDEVRLEDDWVPLDEQLAPEQLEEVLREKDAHSSAVVLESVGDIPEAEIKPPDNVLFVCKLNPVTEDEDLHTIFSRFGTVVSAEVIRDHKTGDSLCYAFIEFETKDSCELAYFKMDNALIDDRRIHVDFSQSVAKLWSQYRRKSNVPNRGKGCFKCGALDHIAKDCTGGPAGTQPPKYILKDDNPQHGGSNNSRYDLVFDEDTLGSPTREKGQRGHDADDRLEKHKAHKRSSEDLRSRDREKRHSSDRHREGDRSNGQRDDEKYQEYKSSRYAGSRRDRDHLEERSDREKHTDRWRDDSNRRDDRNYSRRSDVDGRRERNAGDYHRRRADSDANLEGRGDGSDRRNDDNISRGERQDERDYRKRSSDRDRRDMEDERHYRRQSEDSDAYKRRREEREHRLQGVDDGRGHDHDRKHGGHRRR